MFRIRFGAIIKVDLNAAAAVFDHRRGDRYTDGLYVYRLHQQRSHNGPRAHFEIEPRWNNVRAKGGLPSYMVR